MNEKTPMQEMEDMGTKEGDQACSNEWFYAFEKVRKTSNIAEFIQLLAPFLRKSHLMEYSPIRYDTKTGKPTKFGWRKRNCFKWNGWIGIKYGSWNMPDTISENHPIVSKAKTDKGVSIVMDSVAYTLSYIPARAEGGWDGFHDSGGTTPEHLLLTKSSIIKE